jgi:DNA replication protein DnaC
MVVQKKIEAAKQAIMNACATCRGQGCRVCAKKVERVNVWANAGIPVAYWTYSLQTFTGDAAYKTKLESLLKSVDAIYDSGKLYAFTGKYGVGKTFGACEILKNALARGYVGRYTTMSEVVDMIMAREERFDFKQSLLLSDFIVVDEFDSRYIPSTDRGKDVFGSTLENIIRSRLHHKLPIIFCTNNSSLGEVFDGTFEQTFDSLFSANNVVNIPVGGVDLR